jgi:hypothetical protein
MQVAQVRWPHPSLRQSINITSITTVSFQTRAYSLSCRSLLLHSMYFLGIAMLDIPFTWARGLLNSNVIKLAEVPWLPKPLYSTAQCCRGNESTRLYYTKLSGSQELKSSHFKSTHSHSAVILHVNGNRTSGYVRHSINLSCQAALVLCVVAVTAPTFRSIAVQTVAQNCNTITLFCTKCILIQFAPILFPACTVHRAPCTCLPVILVHAMLVLYYRPPSPPPPPPPPPPPTVTQLES